MTLDNMHFCTQCGRDMGYEWLLGPVCGRCCRRNHARVMGKRGSGARASRHAYRQERKEREEVRR